MNTIVKWQKKDLLRNTIFTQLWESFTGMIICVIINSMFSILVFLTLTNLAQYRNKCAKPNYQFLNVAQKLCVQFEQMG